MLWVINSEFHCWVKYARPTSAQPSAFSMAFVGLLSHSRSDYQTFHRVARQLAALVGELQIILVYACSLFRLNKLDKVYNFRVLHTRNSLEVYMAMLTGQRLFVMQLLDPAADPLLCKVREEEKEVVLGVVISAMVLFVIMS